jgi:hypothetical protein
MSQESSAVSELRNLGLTIEIDELVAKRIKAELLIIDGLRRQGQYKSSLGFHQEKAYYAAYNVVAEIIIGENTPLDVIDTQIPQLVMNFLYGGEELESGYWWGQISDLEKMKEYLGGHIREWTGRIMLMQLGRQDEPLSAERFPKRATWLKQRLKERSWDHNDPIRHNGPDRKTVLKILDGEKVREDVLEKLANALSSKGQKVSPLDIPSD